MDNNLKLTLIRIFLGLKIVFNVLLIIGGFVAADQISKIQFWNDHSNNVLNEIEIVRKQFQTADYTGRNKNITGINENDLNSLRQDVYQGIDHLKIVVGDNPGQVKKLDELKGVVVNRFLSQDEQFRSIKRENNTITYPYELVAASSIYLENIESLFYDIKMTEINLLRLERAPNVFKWQWRTIYFTGFVILASLAISVYLNIMLQKSVIRGLMVSRRMGKLQKTEEKRQKHENEDKRYIRVPLEEWNSWTALLGDSNEQAGK